MLVLILLLKLTTTIVQETEMLKPTSWRGQYSTFQNKNYFYRRQNPIEWSAKHFIIKQEHMCEKRSQWSVVIVNKELTESNG